MAASGLQVASQFSNIGTDPLRDFKYLVNLNHSYVSRRSGKTVSIGFTLGFTNVSGFSVTTSPIAYRAGNMNTTPQMLPGQTQFNPISMARGTFAGDESLWAWFCELFTVNVGTGSSPSNGGRYFRGDINVYLMPHPSIGPNGSAAVGNSFTPVATWKIYNAWPQMFSLGDLSSSDNGYLVQNITFAHEGWDFWPYAA